MTVPDRVARLAERAVGVALAAMLETARLAVPRDVRVDLIDNRIVVSGRALLQRSLTDARLRNIGR